METVEDWNVEKSVFLISASSLVDLGLRSLLDARLGNVRVTGTATSYPPEDALSLSNADMVVLDCADDDDPQDIGRISADIRQTFGKPTLLLADAARTPILRAQADVAHRVVARSASSDLLVDAIEACLREGDGDFNADAETDNPATRRANARVAVQIPARLNAVEGVTRDISAQGLYIELLESAHDIGEAVLIEIDLQSSEGSSTLTLSGEIVRKEMHGKRVGLGIRIVATDNVLN